MKKFKPMWELKQQTDPSVLDLYIYGEVEEETWVDDGWFGHWEESRNSANRFAEVLSEHPDATQINIYINSRGGEVPEGVAIYNQLRRHPAHKTVYVDFWACSVASVIAMAGDEVIMYRSSVMFLHEMSWGAWGPSRVLRKAADDLDTLNAVGRSAYLQKSGDKLTEERLSEMLAAESWLTAEECIELGLADRLADQDADLYNAAVTLQRATQNLEQRLQVHKRLTAQLRELTAQQGAEEKPEPVPPEETDAGQPQEPKPQENAILKLFTNIKI